MELLNQTLGHNGASGTAKNKWWYCILASPDAMPTDPLPGYAAASRLTVLFHLLSLSLTKQLTYWQAARVAAQDAQRTHNQAVGAGGPDPLLDLPAMDASMLGSAPSGYCKQPTHVGGSEVLPRQHTEVTADRALSPGKGEASGGGHEVPAGLIFT